MDDLYDESPSLLTAGQWCDEQTERFLKSVGFQDWRLAAARFQALCPDDDCREALSQCLPMLLAALSQAATPDGSLINFERFVQSVPDRVELFRYLAANPRAVEILIKLFVGSQFLTEILLRNPAYLQQLTNHKRLAEFKSQQQFFHEAMDAAAPCASMDEKLDALRRYQHWELLRIGACDSFGLLDLKSSTVQLSLLADSLVQASMKLVADDLKISTEGFAVLAFGKLGGEELNYSSDIDLVFICDRDAARFWTLGQRLIKALMASTGEGFLYRVDMRLRPWGRSGALVNTIDAHISYLRKHGQQWEKQALLKARVIAGDHAVGREFLAQAEPLIFEAPPELVCQSIRQMKERIEAELERQGRKWGEVKSGAGSIRDIEFTTQCLQLIYGGAHKEVRSINTLDGLVRLADFGFIQADEFRQLTSGYVFLRTVEHALQLMHHKQTHTLPEDRRELAYLARRLDYPNAEQFVAHYERHRAAIRRIYDKYVGDPRGAIADSPLAPAHGMPEHVASMEASYAETFPEEEIARHAQLLKSLSPENLIELEAVPLEDGKWKVTIVGLDHRGDLSRICGLLFVYGFNIVDGHVFSSDLLFTAAASSSGDRKSADRESEQAKVERARKFINVFTVQPPLPMVLPEVWIRYKQDLTDLLRLVRAGREREAQGQLAKRVAGALVKAPDSAAALYPVDVEIDNTASERYTVMHIGADDTIGFLYELSNALALAQIDISRVIVSSVGNRVFDTLFVTDQDGAKIVDPQRQQQLRAAVVLIKHFTHLLPRSPNPEAALLHFSEFLEQLFQRPDWLQDLSSLERTDVLEALAKLLGVSNFLWEDFLRLQHANLFPVVKDVETLAKGKPRELLERELAAELDAAEDFAARCRKLNEFKDREMFRTDMRHILGHITEFGQFSAELTDLAEVVVDAAYRICRKELESRYGQPLLDDGSPCGLSICALGKCGGRELGFASDIELMFIYEDVGRTSGPEQITTTEFFEKLVGQFRQSIQARQEGIFQVDLRLRPYGRAGSLAVSFDAFRNYFGPQGAAWPYERQALVKLRPIAGDREFGERVVALRDSLIYTGEPFDVAAMRGMREKQGLQLVQAGSLNAKLSPGGLVDSEYLVQGLQISHGHLDPALRATNTREAMRALRDFGILSPFDHDQLQEAYIFQRRLIDALRMVRGHARDLTVPPPESEEFEFLARRLGYRNDVERLKTDIEKYTAQVRDLGRLLDQ